MPDEQSFIIDKDGRQHAGLVLTGDDLNRWEQVANEMHILVCASLPHYPHEEQFGPPKCELIATHFVRHYDALHLRPGACVIRSSQRRAGQVKQTEGEK